MVLLYCMPVPPPKGSTTPAGLGENHLAGRRVPLVGIRRADVDLDGPLRQQAELVRAPLFDDFGVGMHGLDPRYVLERLVRIVRTADGDAYRLVGALSQRRRTESHHRPVRSNDASQSGRTSVFR